MHLLNIESFFKNTRYKTLFIWADNKKRYPNKFPHRCDDVIMGIREELQAAAETLTQLAGPPSPPLVS